MTAASASPIFLTPTALILLDSASAVASVLTASARSSEAFFSASAATITSVDFRSASVRAASTWVRRARSATSTARAVTTFSSAETASASAVLASATASEVCLLLAAIWISFSCVAIWISRCASVLRLLIARSDSITAVSFTCLAPASFSATAPVGVDAGILLGQARSLRRGLRPRRGCSRSCWRCRAPGDSSASFLVRSIVRVCCRASRSFCAIATSLSRTMALRSRRRVSVTVFRLGQAFGVEEVLRVEEFDVGLVELGQRHRFQFEPVRLHVGLDRRLHVLDEIAALFLQLQDGHGRRHRTQAVDEFRLDLVAQRFGVVGQRAQRLARERDALVVGTNAHVELGDDVDAQAVLGDQGFPLLALDCQPQRLQIDAGIGVEDRQDHGAAVEHDLLAAEAGAHEGLVAGGALVEDGEDDPEDDDQRDADHGRDCNVEHEVLR